MSDHIPQIFHQIWLQGELPDIYKKLRDRMMEMHPNWKYQLWTEKNRPKLFNEDFYKDISRASFKSDILRYEILYAHGGVYIDTDFFFLKNIDSLVNQELLFAEEYERPSSENPLSPRHLLNNCIIGCSKKHYLLHYMVMKLKENHELYKAVLKEGKIPNGWNLVGPVFLDRSVRSVVGPLLGKPSFSYPKSYFCPFRAEEIKAFGGFRKTIDKLPKETVALHLWNSRFSHKEMDLLLNDT